MDADTQYWKSTAEAERKKNAQLLKRCGELAQDKDDLCKRLDEREATIRRLVDEIEGKNEIDPGNSETLTDNGDGTATYRKTRTVEVR